MIDINKYKYYIAIVIVLIICLVIYFISSSEHFTTTSSTGTKSSTKTSSDENKMSVKYFGGSYCPHSRVGSRAYTLIKDFQEKYPNIKVEYYWTGEDNEEFTNANAEYVPTITDGKYNKIELSLPEGVDTSNKTDEELKHLVLVNIRNQL